jgi:hypothetical protein
VNGFTIAGHVAIDKVITIEGENIQLGGPPCFSSVLGESLGFIVEVVTKIGFDFPTKLEPWLHSLGIFQKYCKDPTTRFELDYRIEPRKMKALKICESINISEVAKADRLLLSPIANEINDEIIMSIKPSFLALDPQGFLRKINIDHTVTQKSWNNKMVLRKLDLMKTSIIEHHLITGVSNIKDSLRKLHKLGVNIAVITAGSNGSYVMSNSNLYWIPIYPVNVVDSTGAGDVFTAGLVAYLDEGLDWACSIASASSSAIVETRGPVIKCSKMQILERAECINENIVKLA